MINIIEPDNAIVEVNNALNGILSHYLNVSGQKIDIRFDLPEMESIPSYPTVSVFLYDIHEDLQLRSAESRSYHPASSTLLPGWVNINYNYLITYWHSNKPSSDSTNPDSQPNSQAAKVMTCILNALVNSRQLPTIPGAYTRVIPPQENLNSLGNFWQALSNRPRLSLLYSVTAPVKLLNIKDAITPVSRISSSINQKSSINSSQINQVLTKKLYSDLGGTEDAYLALAKVNLKTEFTAENNESRENKNVILNVSGITHSDYVFKIRGILATWKNSHSAIVNVSDTGIIIEEYSEELIGI
ncbi:hypothetical protein Ppb6_01881 [Photorhabdus australis subsp. thailandensis]|uniref:Pvc16 N-terminal domain-containing protein n=1 Tax=Photorhabdus australis subsp. thailandensis TaxID=2805096 RepID=A0A1C0U4Y8_9GAMM|nr:DUF4255 domain-containing protein [Photorhabdus australis]OCQ52988.1 hypothetical protein Ppb6_01881 [Photorhabdus australis subsp. thailandensis]